MAIPSPVPCILLVVEFSALVKGSKIVFINSGVHSISGICNCNGYIGMFRYTAWLFCQIQDNASPNRCIFNSIGQQIDKDLAQAHRVSQKMSMIDPVNMDLKLLSPFFFLWTMILSICATCSIRSTGSSFNFTSLDSILLISRMSLISPSRC